ncbi:MAG TPA: succinate dehydrogenase/fumarate reductase iron-sulfur subunit [Methanomassiliicoccales archaeon]|jgi:succinate dehydrogenase / fumarate reductase iron-sulfur subunit
MKIRVFRKALGQNASYRVYEVEERQGMTVLDALFQIHDRQDDSLSFRYSCRGAVCGSCAMLINKVPRLACRTQMAGLVGEAPLRLAPSASIVPTEGWDPKQEALIEPLPNMAVLKDLIVDMDGFYAKYRKVGPTLLSMNTGEKESLMTAEAVKELERYTNCIMCAACYSACPVNGTDPEYIGPAALAKLYRFAMDPRDREGARRLSKADEPHGWWACRFYTNCNKVCPKDVPPNVAIGKARQDLMNRKKGTEGKA